MTISTGSVAVNIARGKVFAGDFGLTGLLSEM
jgi:hypothetical protein